MSRDDFDRERLADTSWRKHCAKHKGRNHMANWKRRRLAQEKRLAFKIVAARELARRRRILARTRAYWRGEGDHP